MREILFRAKRADNGEWVEGYYIVAAGMAFMSIFTVKEPIRVNHKTIGQYTGLTDKNGKKIFEGDIVKVRRQYKSLICVVEWQICGFTIRDQKDSSYIIYDKIDIEVIGNIYDNPELLEVE